MTTITPAAIDNASAWLRCEACLGVLLIRDGTFRQRRQRARTSSAVLTSMPIMLRSANVREIRDFDFTIGAGGVLRNNLVLGTKNHYFSVTQAITAHHAKNTNILSKKFQNVEAPGIKLQKLEKLNFIHEQCLNNTTKKQFVGYMIMTE